MSGTEGAALSVGQQGHRRKECSKQLWELQCLEGSLVTNPQRITPWTLVRPKMPKSQRHSHGFPASDFPNMAAFSVHSQVPALDQIPEKSQSPQLPVPMSGLAT